MSRWLPLLFIVLLSPAVAFADGGISSSAFGEARAIPRTRSASRDAPALNYLLVPRPTLTAAGELGLVRLFTTRWSLRLGFFGGLELESQNEIRGGGGAFLPVGDIRFWRGYNGFSLALEDQRLSRLVCGECQLELALVARHESEHYTGSNTGGPGTDFSMQSQVGDFFMPDVGLSWRSGKLAAYARAQVKVFFPNRSSYAIAPALDMHGRYRILPSVELFGSLFVETQRGRRTDIAGPQAMTHPREFPNSNTVRTMAGVAVPSDRGALMVYLYATRGHRKGLAVFTREQVIGLGLRLALDPF